MQLFGYSFTVLTASTLVLAYLGVVTCYGLLRTLVLMTPGPALFGTLLRVLNPLYLHLSYSFMTDVPFMTLMSGSALLILWGLDREDDRLLLGAMLRSAAVGLVRQPGILPAGVLGGYLLWTRRLSLRRALAVGAAAGSPPTIPYTIGEKALSGYHVLGSVPYYTRLGGFTTRTVWLLERNGLRVSRP